MYSIPDTGHLVFQPALRGGESNIGRGITVTSRAAYNGNSCQWISNFIADTCTNK